VLPKRLDFNRIAKHYQQHGAEGSFITQNVRILLPDGEMSKRVYIMPKYSMDRVSQSQADMQAALRLATAQTATDVERSCANLATGTYDFKRHMHLRQNYVTVFLTSDGSVLDMHKDFMKGGGFSEHSIFFDRLVHFRGDFLDSFCQGPRNNRPQSRRKKKNGKKSEALNRMLAAPAAVASVHEDSVALQHPVKKEFVRSSSSRTVKKVVRTESFPIPKLEAAAKDFFGSLMQRSQNKDCAAKTKDGFRCTRPAERGMFCKQHAKLTKTTKFVSKSWEAVGKFVQSAKMAYSKTRAPMDAHGVGRSLSLVNRRLDSLGRLRQNTEPDGDCQFLAVVATAELDLSAHELRAQVCDYLQMFPEIFNGFWTGFPNFEQYIQHMRKAGSWGDHLTLLAASHLLLRPIMLVTDTTHEESATILVTPPDFISSDLWGPPLCLAFYAEVHYEATIPKPK
jgi:hypothetical protein